MAIYASLVHGIDLDRWGAFGFSKEVVRDQLARELQEGDLVLSIGTMGEPTPEPLRGRLLALMKVGRRQVFTQDYVEPQHWANHLAGNNGVPRWPYGLPIISAEVFSEPLPEKNVALPRFKEANLHMKLATNYERLTPDEEMLVLKQLRETAPSIYQAQSASFMAGLLQRRPGPPPSTSPRIISRTSGAAATYLLRLEGKMAVDFSGSKLVIAKGGFSTDPIRRLKEINSFLPDENLLRWSIELEQWHIDEVNAYAMEQELFRQLSIEGFLHLKGELYRGDPRRLRTAWYSALQNAIRPEIDEEGQLMHPAVDPTHT